MTKPASRTTGKRPAAAKSAIKQPTKKTTAASTRAKSASIKAAAPKSASAKSVPPKLALKQVGKTSARPVSKSPARPLRQPASVDAGRQRDIALGAVDQTLALLDELARSSPATTETLEHAVGCGHTTLLRLMAALEARGFAVHAAGGAQWQLGPRWDVMRRAAHTQGALAAASMPFLETLAKATGENVYLRARDGLEAETIAVSQADPVLRVYTEVGTRGPLHAGPARLLLAHAPEAVQTQVLSQRLQRFTPATRTDPTWIAADLHRLRVRGYLITADEVNAGVASVSAPVRDASGQVIAVLILSAPSMRLRPPRPRQLLPMVLDAASQLTRALGGPATQINAIPAANGVALPSLHSSAASLPTSPPSPAAWVR